MWGHVTNVTPIPDVIHESMYRPSRCRMRIHCVLQPSEVAAIAGTPSGRAATICRGLCRTLLWCHTTPRCSVIAGVSPYNILTTCRPCLRPPVSLCTAVHQCSSMYNTHEQHWYSQFVSNSCAGQTWSNTTVTTDFKSLVRKTFSLKNWFLDELWINCEWLWWRIFHWSPRVIMTL